MDQFEYSSTTSSGFRIDNTLRHHWQDISRWGRIISIIYFVLLGFALLAFVGMATAFTALGDELAYNPVLSGQFVTVIMLIGLVATAIGIYLNYRHFQFANQLKAALLNNDQPAFERAWQHLRVCFRWYGYFTIAYIAVYVIAFVVFGGSALSSLMFMGR